MDPCGRERLYFAFLAKLEERTRVDIYDLHILKTRAVADWFTMVRNVERCV